MSASSELTALPNPNHNRAFYKAFETGVKVHDCNISVRGNSNRRTRMDKRRTSAETYSLDEGGKSPCLILLGKLCVVNNVMITSTRLIASQ